MTDTLQDAGAFASILVAVMVLYVAYKVYKWDEKLDDAAKKAGTSTSSFLSTLDTKL
jgi:hypothetical protein